VTIPASLGRAALGLHRWIYVASRGRAGHLLLGVPTLLLWTTGRRSGARRVAALIYLADDDRFVVVASNGGATAPPAWLRNLEADPGAEVWVGRSRLAVSATVVRRGEATHAELWRRVNQANRGRYDRYQARTARPIPLVVLTPAPRG
jgi:deazaflavin-dependent oxidoreductase (nitroreductase family)